MLQVAIIAAYEENCPLKRRSESDVKWWNADLQKLLRRARCTLNKAKKIKSLEASEEVQGEDGPKGVQEGHKEGQETVVA
ncbi:unnamed protein product [Lasius platythorax]|uniref:Uncharacterized protein n=1 Tax=Lasius platythorax TaxID=488582 RepID=A0AAV2NZ79_9HYME